jgi:hypothetical protein
VVDELDDFTRECLAIDVAGSIRSKRVIEILSRLVSAHGAPIPQLLSLEFVSHAILEWIALGGIGTALINPGKTAAVSCRSPGARRAVGDVHRRRAGHRARARAGLVVASSGHPSLRSLLSPLPVAAGFRIHGARRSRPAKMPGSCPLLTLTTGTGRIPLPAVPAALL